MLALFEHCQNLSELTIPRERAAYRRNELQAGGQRMKESLTPNTTISHYRIVSHLGAGGMGEVYLGEDTRLKRKVALKLLPAELTESKDRLQRFEQEASAASALNHPNIITIYEIGEADQRCFIATEFIDGRTLREEIARGGMTLGKALD